MIFIEILVIAYFAYVVFYTLIFSVAAFVKRNPAPRASRGFANALILIPAYKEDNVIITTAKRALKQEYPESKYKVIVIADSLETTTLEQLANYPLEVLEVNFEESTKVKSLNAALVSVNEGFDFVVILDADNVMGPAFLDKVNQTYQAGHKAIQGRRVAKNKNSKLAVLDGLSEILNNHIFRAGSSSLGLSSALSGSAMAFDFHLLKSTLAEMDSVGGFDRELEVKLVMQGEKVRYVNNAIVFDEKTAGSKNFANQRRRWIASQYHYLGKYFGVGMKGLLTGKLALFNSAVFRNIQLPRVINLGLLGMISLSAYWLQSMLQYDYRIWWLFMGLMTFSLLLAVPLHFYNRRFWNALLALPGTFLVMLSLMFRLKGANEKFLHTAHGSEIDQKAETPQT